MIRVILRRKIRDQASGADFQNIETLDVDMPALEACLSRGGFGESGYDLTSIIGIEVLRDQPHSTRESQWSKT